MKNRTFGLGIMGSTMAAYPIRAGVPVTVWNRSPEKCAPLEELAAKTADFPRAATANDCSSSRARPAALKVILLPCIRSSTEFG